uniref:Integrase catalytic domain-containing protein n=1 Tax=Lygus hesperus TaxID=30085 RepID=A0A146M766_LYGHE
MWWSGPPWLCQPEQTWPSMDCYPSLNLPELKPDTVSVLVTTKTGLHECISWMARVSSYEKLIRIVATLNRAMVSRYHKTKPSSRCISSDEFKEAEHLCVKAVQRYFLFNGLVPDISKISSKFSSLNPFIDVKGIVRVGGRLSNSNLPEYRKHQILLPSQAHFSHILVDHYHKVFLHPGPNLQQAVIQTRFWIPAARKLIRHRTFLCLKCYKSRAKFITPMMGDLPKFRVEGGRAFLHVGVDLAGPFTIRESHRRKAPRSKAYLCLYVCMTTKALHLEIVSNQSTDAFLASFTRLISRRGYPTDVYSDCGSNFRGASRELKEFEKWFRESDSQNAIEAFSSSRGVKWHFNPPYSPHFGGLWEAGVKAVKRHLYLTAGNAVLTFEELGTLFCKIEAILNSRPLCPLSTDPAESDYLTPGHFLIGAHLNINPEPSLLDIQDNRLSRWQYIKKLSEQIWQRWHLEYLATLQARNKWRKPTENLRVGDLVLIKSSDTPVLQWPTAKVTEVHPGHDGAVRVVTLKTANGTYKRTVVNLIPLLPLNQSSEPTPSF